MVYDRESWPMISPTTSSASRTLHVVSPVAWIAEAFHDAIHSHDLDSHELDSLDAENPHTTMNPAAMEVPIRNTRRWRIASHPLWERPEDIIQAIHDDDALWIAPAALISLNVWRSRHGMRPWRMRTPSPRWMEQVSRRLTGRHTLFATVEQVREWRTLPSELGILPWSQLCGGRVDGFNAARRNLATLQTALTQAPKNAMIELDEHVRDITEEWVVAMHHGQVLASSGYCIHTSPDSHSIVTVFDLDATHRYTGNGGHGSFGADPTFNLSHRAETERVARMVCVQGEIGDASILVAWRGAGDEPIALEADPLWCTTPYPVPSTQMMGVIEAIRQSRVAPSGDGENGVFATPLPPGETTFTADPWMLERYTGLFLTAQPSS